MSVFCIRDQTQMEYDWSWYFYFLTLVFDSIDKKPPQFSPMFFWFLLLHTWEIFCLISDALDNIYLCSKLMKRLIEEQAKSLWIWQYFSSFYACFVCKDLGMWTCLVYTLLVTTVVWCTTGVLLPRNKPVLEILWN